MAMAAADRRELILEALQGVAPDIDTAGIDEHSNFRDQYEIDSVDFLNFVLALERRLAIAEADYPSLSSLGGCLRYLADRGLAP
jgi:acyl carrier protein